MKTMPTIKALYVRDQYSNPPLPVDRLQAALELVQRSLTPPPDTEENSQRIRLHEEHARQFLSKEGCPPCYPSSFTPPFQHISEPYKAIITFWDSSPGLAHAQLWKQYEDWKRFKKYQKGRRSQQRSTIFILRKEILERRRRHGLGGGLSLHFIPEKQTLADTWLEYHDYHLIMQEQMDADLQVDERMLDNIKNMQQHDIQEVLERAHENA
ncbi:hypothetical protein EJ08DRAFT_333995 [Tothia fuscella]|uniref:Uncharacterized protein n=1 Tax=Tothia fuscella TaxID=1048955 RepID=A0A9P4P1Y2_9PEZI|nr:hypothetical protein EJ08DRAFT_333995 [Tothia fuscella]